MKEFKTCEDYVLNRVVQLESEKAEADNRIAELEAELAKKEEFIEVVKSRVRLRGQAHGDIYIDFNSVWKKYDGKLYTKFIECFGLANEEAEILKDNDDENAEEM